MMKRSTLESVYRKYMPDLYRYLRTLCGDDAAAEDLVQETFYRAYLHLENYRDEKVKALAVSRGLQCFYRYETQRTPQHCLSG